MQTLISTSCSLSDSLHASTQPDCNKQLRPRLSVCMLASKLSAHLWPCHSVAQRATVAWLQSVSRYKACKQPENLASTQSGDGSYPEASTDPFPPARRRTAEDLLG